MFALMLICEITDLHLFYSNNITNLFSILRSWINTETLIQHTATLLDLKGLGVV
jgi:hypothetical protein